MKRLLIAAGVAGLSLSATVAEAGQFWNRKDEFRIRYNVQYQGGAYLGYPSTTKYSVNYYPQISPGGNGYIGAAGSGAPLQDNSANPVYPRHLGQGYTVNGYPGPYTSYKYDYRQRYHYQYPDQGGNGACGCNNGGRGQASGMIIENRVDAGGQSSSTVSPPLPIDARTQYQATPIPVVPQDQGTPVPNTVVPKAKEVAPKATVHPKTARGAAQGTPVLVSEENTTEE